MRTIFSTASAGVPQAEACDYWQDVAVRAISNNESRMFDPPNFYGELQTGTLNDLAIFAWRCALGESTTASTEDLLLALRPSRCVADLDDQILEGDRNHNYLMDYRRTTRNYTRSLEPIDRVFVRIPPAVLQRRIPFEKGVNRAIPLTGAAEMLDSYVRNLIRIGPSKLSPAEVAIARQTILDHTAAMLGSLTGVTPKLGRADDFLSLSLKAAIDRDPNATRDSIAAAAGVSVRHANRLLALEGTSIQRLLTERRLSKCREAIENQRHRRISDIAYAYGFRDLSHFGRAFKSRFGLTPSDYRAAFDSTGQQSPRRSSAEG